ncbi:MAG: PDZ domain-containing protein, partial [Planctomycetales bacterium]|nr:PDZ domain-containing protein [Planctomycetales bacterium]
IDAIKGRPEDLSSNAARRGNNDLDSWEALVAEAREVWDRTTPTIQVTNAVGAEYDVPRSALFLHGLLRAVVGGPRLIGAREVAVAKQLHDNRYVGIGVRLSGEQGVTVIVDPIYLGPAWEADLKANDRIVGIDGEVVVGRELGEVVDLLRGPLGTHVNLTIERAGRASFDVELVRREVPIATVEGMTRDDDGVWRLRPSEGYGAGDGIGVVRITSVGGSTVAELRQMLRLAQAQECSSIVIDCRSCTLADPHQCQLLADLLLGDTAMGAVVRGEAREELRSRADGMWLDRPIVFVLSPRTSPEVAWVATVVRARQDVRVLGQVAVYRPFLREDVELLDGSLLQGLPVARLRNHANEVTMDGPGQSGPPFMKLALDAVWRESPANGEAAADASAGLGQAFETARALVE